MVCSKDVLNMFWNFALKRYDLLKPWVPTSSSSLTCSFNNPHIESKLLLTYKKYLVSSLLVYCETGPWSFTCYWINIDRSKDEWSF